MDKESIEKQKKIVAVIPAFNEAKKTLGVLSIASEQVDNIIFVDDGSTDNTFEEAKKFGNNVIALRHRLNFGKGSALKTGCEAAIKIGADIIVLMDSDGQHKPIDIPRFVDKINSQDSDIVFGSRKIGKDMPIVMMIGNKMLSIFTSFLFGIYISDTQSGFRAFKSEAYPKIKWNSNRYAVETEIIVNVAKNNLKFSEIEIETIYSDDYKGTTVIDGIRIFINMLIWKIL